MARFLFLLLSLVSAPAQAANPCLVDELHGELTAPAWATHPTQIEHHLLTGVIAKRRPLDGSSHPEWVELNHGEKGVLKASNVSEASTPRHEVGAYLVDQRLELHHVSPTVLVHDQGVEKSLQYFVSDSKETGVEKPAPLVLFDYLIGNSDRKGANSLMSQGWLVAIDNGRSFNNVREVEHELPFFGDVTQYYRTQLQEVQDQIAKLSQSKLVVFRGSKLEKLQGQAAELEKKIKDTNAWQLDCLRKALWNQRQIQILRETGPAEWHQLLGSTLAPEEIDRFLQRREKLLKAIDTEISRYGQAALFGP